MAMTEDAVQRVKQEVTALDAFLSVDPQRPKETQQLFVKSLGATITVRELDEGEINDVLARYEEVSDKLRAGHAANQIDQQARIVALALVDPNMRDPAVMDKLDKHFRCGVNAEMAVRAVFRPLEITRIANRVMEISGMSDDAVTDAGN